MNRALVYEFMMKLIGKSAIRLSKVIKSIALSHFFPLQLNFQRREKLILLSKKRESTVSFLFNLKKYQSDSCNESRK